MGLRVGIDLGTTYCAVAYVDDDGRPRIIENSAGERTTPSVLCFREDGRVLFGEEAKELQESGEANTASFYKRNMGESSYGVCLGGKPRTPEDLSATFLQLLVEDAEKAIGQSIDSAVITVPAYFAARERQATINAGKRAGLEVIALLNEPSAAAYAYGLVGGGAARQTVLIYDLGGGTFDATVACIDEQEVRVLGSGGNHKLGGKDWDDALARYMIEVMCDELDVDSATLILSTQEMNALIVQAEQVKRQLSSRARVRVRITAGGESAVVEVSRADFENVTAHLLHATIDVVEELLSECDLSWRDIDGTILVGGSTRMPGVEGFLKEATGKRPLAGVNPDESVAIGAAIRANAQIRMQAEERRLGVVEKPLPTLPGLKRLVDATAHAMGMIAESADRSRYVNSVMIPKNSPVPACKEKDYTLRVPDAGGIFEVYVLQGENERVLDNAVFAKYIISDIQRENGAESIVTVSYRYTENATIEVAARQNGLGRDLEVCEAEIDEDLSRFDGPPPSLEESSGKTNLRVTIAIDVSGSMSGSPLEEAKRAIKEFGNRAHLVRRPK